MLAIPLLLAPATVYAASDQLSQKILPMNCVFEEVNDGLGSLYYLTPEACGVVTSPSQSVPQPTQGSQVFVKTPQLQSYNPNQPYVGSLNVRVTLPWQPIVAVVKGDGTVIIGTQSPGRQAKDTSLLNIIGNLIGVIGTFMQPTITKIAVGITAGVFIVVLVAVILI